VCYVNCPRCGLVIGTRASWVAPEFCPRCLGRARLAVPMDVSARPGPAPVNLKEPSVADGAEREQPGRV
jgi:hypothetical protein